MRSTPEEARERLQLATDARKEHEAFKAARVAGKPLPATPALDELRRRQADMTSTKATTTARGGGGTRTPKAVDVHFTHDGKLVAATQNKLSSVAWFYTKGLGKGGGRLKVGELVALLKTLGVDEPHKAGWSVKLSNGVTLGAVKKGETPTPIAKPPTVSKRAAAGKRVGDAIKAKRVAKAKTAAKTPAKKSTKATPKKQTAKARKAAEAKSAKGIIDAVIESAKSGPNAEATKAASKKVRATAAPTKLAPDKRVRNATKAKADPALTTAAK